MILNKRILYTPLYVFVVPILKENFQKRIVVGIDECAFYKKKIIGS